MSARQKWILIALAIIPVVAVGARFGLVKSYAYALEAHRSGNYSTALPIVYGNALIGDSAACGLLGTMYLFGQGVEKNGGQAEYWLGKAANHELVEAQSLLGLMYATGQGVPRDRDKAIAWLAKAAAGGDTHATALLHQLYRGEKI